MTPHDMLANAAQALTQAHDLATKAADSAEVDPDKTDRKVQRLGYVADQWLKAAAMASELAPKAVDDPS